MFMYIIHFNLVIDLKFMQEGEEVLEHWKS